MKYLHIVLILLVCSSSLAREDIEAISGGITYHVLTSDDQPSELYSNKMSSDGRLIYTPMLGIRYTVYPEYEAYRSYAIFRGTNSVGAPISGGMFSIGVAFTYVKIGLGVGGYIQNDQDFEDRGIQPFSIVGHTNALVPLLGTELNFSLPIDDKYFISLNNLISPIITNTSLSFGIKY